MIYEITKFDDLMEELPFIVDSVDAMKDGRYPVKTVVEAIRRNIGRDDFKFLIQDNDKGGKAFIAAFINVNLYQEKIGVIWLLRSKNGNPKEFSIYLKSWFKDNGCVSIEAGNGTLTKAKERWLKRMGFKLFLQVWKMEV